MPSITRAPSPGPERRSVVEAQVIAAVERLLAQGMSFTEISVQRIITEADIARSTFYVHFRDKSDLLSRLADTLRESHFTMGVVWEPTGPSGGVDRLAQVFEEVIASHRKHFTVLSAISEIAAYDPAVRDFYTSDLDDFENRVIEVLRAQQSAGRTPADLDPVAASRVIVWGGEQAIAHHIGVDDGSGDAAFARELARIWWYGAYSRPAED
ncbi:TetR/AcrR family transcriptional regulator [Streptomyces sp. NPDC006923]|uniref:TetR/AcrR family transcriptional regulator n=1 Tax=Streptomyces sp. NPDC006923 TaxID=3155355 RepID=UPI0033D10DDE